MNYHKYVGLFIFISISFNTGADNCLAEPMQNLHVTYVNTVPKKLLTIIREMREKSLRFVEIWSLKKVYKPASYLSELSRFIASSHWLLAFFVTQPHKASFI